MFGFLMLRFVVYATDSYYNSCIKAFEQKIKIFRWWWFLDDTEQGDVSDEDTSR